MITSQKHFGFLNTKQLFLLDNLELKSAVSCATGLNAH